MQGEREELRLWLWIRLISERVAERQDKRMRAASVLVLLVVVVPAACGESDEDAQRDTGLVSTTTTTIAEPTTSAQRPLDCPGDRYETAEADFFGDEPEKPYQGAATPELALAEEGGYKDAEFSRLPSTDPAHIYIDAAPAPPRKPFRWCSNTARRPSP